MRSSIKVLTLFLSAGLLAPNVAPSAAADGPPFDVDIRCTELIFSPQVRDQQTSAKWPASPYVVTSDVGRVAVSRDPYGLSDPGLAWTIEDLEPGQTATVTFEPLPGHEADTRAGSIEATTYTTVPAGDPCPRDGDVAVIESGAYGVTLDVPPAWFDPPAVGYLDEVSVAAHAGQRLGDEVDLDAVYLGDGRLLVDRYSARAQTLDIDGVEIDLSPATGVVSQRIAGANRYETAAAIAEILYDPSVTPQDIVLASGEDFPDALVAAGRTVLLTGRDYLPPATRSYLESHDSVVHVIGGPAAVSDLVVNEVSNLVSGPVYRIAGDTRYETAAAWFEATYRQLHRIILVSGERFPDALAAGGLGRTILLTTRDHLSEPTRAALSSIKPVLVTVVGGPSAVSDEVMAEVAALGHPVERVAGEDRTTTSAKLFRHNIEEFLYRNSWTYLRDYWRSVPIVVVRGDDFPDALAAAGLGLPVVLTRSSTVTGPGLDALWSIDCRVTGAIIVGGQSALPDSTAEFPECRGDWISVAETAETDLVDAYVALANDRGINPSDPVNLDLLLGPGVPAGTWRVGEVAPMSAVGMLATGESWVTVADDNDDRIADGGVRMHAYEPDIEACTHSAEWSMALNVPPDESFTICR